MINSYQWQNFGFAFIFLLNIIMKNLLNNQNLNLGSLDNPIQTNIENHQTNLYLRHRCYEFSSWGKIVYDPARGGAQEPWSAVIEVEQDLIDYYRYLFLCHYRVSLIKPSWKAHISLIRGIEEYTPLVEQFWKEMDGQMVEFHYTHEVFWNTQHVWVNTYCEEFFRLREKMGLDYTHVDNQAWGHITIGKFRKSGQMPAFMNYYEFEPV